MEDCLAGGVASLIHRTNISGRGQVLAVLADYYE